MAVVELCILVVQAGLELRDLALDGAPGTVGGRPCQTHRRTGVAGGRSAGGHVGVVHSGRADVPADDPPWVDADDPPARALERRGLELDLLRDAADLHEADSGGSGGGVGNVVDGEGHLRTDRDVAELG